MNRFICTGNLVRDPEVGSTAAGTSYTRFTIAVNRPFADSNGNRIADYFDIVTWKNLAERCAKYLFKGNKVAVGGRVERKQYEDRDGIKRTTFDVVADEVEFLSQKQNGENTPSNQQSDTKGAGRENIRTTSKTSRSGQNNGFSGDLTPVPQSEADDLPF